MLRNDDLKKLDERYVNKQEFTDTMNQAVEKLTHIINDRSDQLMSELRAIRQEQAFSKQHHDDLKDRVSAIESTPTVAHELKSKN